MKNKSLNLTPCKITEYGLQQLSSPFINIDPSGWMWKGYKYMDGWTFSTWILSS